jgi:hypothetical protein
MTGLNVGGIKRSSRLLEQFWGAVCGVIYSKHGLLSSHDQNAADPMAKDWSDPKHGSDIRCLEAPDKYPAVQICKGFAIFY